MKPIQTFKEAKFRTAFLIERFRKEAQGVAAVEFAIIAPLMILLFFATLEVSTAVAVNRKISRVSSTVGDLVTQSETLTNSDIADIMRSASYVMKPYDHTVGIVITGIEIESGAATVVWSKSQNATAATIGATYAVPIKIKNDGTFLVSAKVSTSHSPMVAFTKMGANRQLTFDTTAIEMEEEIFLRPRISSRTMIE